MRYAFAWLVLVGSIGFLFTGTVLAQREDCSLIPDTRLVLRAISDESIRRVAFCEGEKSLYVEITTEGFPGPITSLKLVVFTNVIDTIDGEITQHVALRPHDSILASNLIDVFAVNLGRNTVTVVREVSSDQNPVLEIDFVEGGKFPRQ